MEQNQPKATDRRSFLTAEPLRRWWNQERPVARPDAVDGSVRNRQGNPSNAESKPGFLLELNKSAMACQWDAFLNYGQYPDAASRVVEAFEIVDRMEEDLSVFRPQSEVSRLNALAFFREVNVSEHLADLLQTAIELYQGSEGAFDITSGPLTDLWGFARRDGKVPSQKEIDLTLQHVGFDKVQWSAKEQSVKFASQKTKINLGGIGKGFALQKCCQFLLQSDICDFVIHAGQSSVVGQGVKLTTEESCPSAGWKVGLTDPLLPEKTLGHFHLTGVALGTSGSGRQFFHYKGKRFSHIFDPRTGWPAEGVLSSTVIAPDATIADALATACFILGPEGCQQLCRQLPELAVLLVIPKGNSGKEILKFGPVDQYWKPAGNRKTSAAFRDKK